MPQQTNTQILLDIQSRLTVISDDVAELKSDMVIVKNDIATLKTDVATLKTDVATLKTDMIIVKKDIATLKSDVSSLNDWKKKISTATEETINTQFEKVAKMQCPACTVTRIFLEDFYEISSNNKLTEFDGCFILKTNPSVQFRPKNANMKKALSQARPLRNNSSSIGSEYLFIIETKTTIDKRQIDNKFTKVRKIYNTIKDIKTGATPVNRISQQCKDMIDRFEVTKFPDYVICIFAASSMSTGIMQYIRDVKDGKMTAEKYYESTMRILQEDRTFNEFQTTLGKLKATPKPRSLSQDVMNLINNPSITNIDSLHESIRIVSTIPIATNATRLANQVFYDAIESLQQNGSYLTKCSLPYDQNLYTSLIGKVGFIKDQSVVTPLFDNSV